MALPALLVLLDLPASELELPPLVGWLTERKLSLRLLL